MSLNISLHMSTYPFKLSIAVEVGQILEAVIVQDEGRGVTLVSGSLLQPLQSPTTQVQHHFRFIWYT